MGRAALSAPTEIAETPRTDAVEAAVSTTLPQVWHSAQRPTHLMLVQPHSVQRKVEVGRAIRTL